MLKLKVKLIFEELYCNSIDLGKAKVMCKRSRMIIKI